MIKSLVRHKLYIAMVALLSLPLPVLRVPLPTNLSTLYARTFSPRRPTPRAGSVQRGVQQLESNSGAPVAKSVEFDSSTEQYQRHLPFFISKRVLGITSSSTLSGRSVMSALGLAPKSDQSNRVIVMHRVGRTIGRTYDRLRLRPGCQMAAGTSTAW